MYKLGALAVARNHDLSRWAFGDGLSIISNCSAYQSVETYSIDQVEHSGSPLRVTSSEKTEDVSRVSDTLNSHAAGTTKTASKSIEEGRPFTVGRSDVAILGGAAGIDDSDGTARCAISQLVVCVAAILAFSQCDLFRHITGLELLSVLLYSKTGVDNVCDWEADSLFLGDWCWGSKSCADQSSE
jgi:hypothetical protein